ncbi:MAG TPA: tetratricopeptide repeat protein, partial [Bacteroidia bacterium]|nr:tetratricopeptide repeat protein [Bacteroidia bacterium]
MPFRCKSSFLTIIFSVLIFCAVQAQASKSDSLIKVLQSQREDTNAVKTIHRICVAMLEESNPQGSLDYAKKGIAMAERLKLGRPLINQYYHAGKACILLSNYDEAFKYLDYAIKNGKEYEKLYPQCLSAMGTVCIKQGNYPKALDYLLESLKIKEEMKDSVGIISTRSNIGNLYAKMKDRDKAMAEYRKCLAIAVHTSDDQLASTYINIANAFVLFDKRDSSDHYLLKALEICRRDNNKRTLMVLYGNLGLNASDAGDTKKAEAYFFEVIKVCEEIGNKEFIGSTYSSLAELYFRNKDYSKAILYGEKSLKAALEMGILSSQLDARGVLFDAYKASGKSAQALEQYEKLAVVRDSMLGAEKQKEVTRKELNFEFEKKEALQKAEQDKIAALAEEEKEKQRVILYAVCAGFLLLAIIAVIIYRSLRRNKEQNKIISLQKEMVEEKQKEILDSIHYAERIQKTLLANHDEVNKVIPDSFVYFQPKDIVSGDFYWATHTQNKNGIEQLYLTVADSTGHGVPGAFMSLLNISFLNEAINEKEIHQPNEVLNHVRKRLIESMEGRQDGMDAILMRFIGSGGNMKIDYAAAHNAPLLIRNGELLHLKADKMPVGKGEKTDDFTLHSIEVKKGDLLYLYTDGYPDQFGGAQGKKFKYKQLEQF